MRVFNPSGRPRLCPALQETLFPFEAREVVPEYEEQVRNCPFGDACECERSEDTPEAPPIPKASTKRTPKDDEVSEVSGPSETPDA